MMPTVPVLNLENLTSPMNHEAGFKPFLECILKSRFKTCRQENLLIHLWIHLSWLKVQAFS